MCSYVNNYYGDDLTMMWEWHIDSPYILSIKYIKSISYDRSDIPKIMDKSTIKYLVLINGFYNIDGIWSWMR